MRLVQRQRHKAWITLGANQKQQRLAARLFRLGDAVLDVFQRRHLLLAGFGDLEQQGWNVLFGLDLLKRDRLDGDEVFVEERTGDVFLSGAGDLECLRQG